LCPILYMRDYMCNSGQKQYHENICFVDEMQDYSVAQLKYLRYAFPKDQMDFIG